MSVTSVDLPEPDTPVTATNRPSGNATVRSRRLCWRAPMTPSLRPGAGVPRRGGARGPHPPPPDGPAGGAGGGGPGFYGASDDNPPPRPPAAGAHGTTTGA